MKSVSKIWISLAITAVTIHLSACAENNEGPTNMGPVVGIWKVISEPITEERFWYNEQIETLEVAEVRGIKVQVLDPEEYAEIIYTVFQLPNEGYDALIDSEMGTVFSYSVIRHALERKDRIFNMGAIHNLSKVKNEESNNTVEDNDHR